MAAAAPYPLQKIMDCFSKDGMKKAREIQLGLIAANGAVTARFGMAGLKMAMDQIGMYGGLRVLHYSLRTKRRAKSRNGSYEKPGFWEDRVQSAFSRF